MLKYTTRSIICNWVLMKQQELIRKIYWISAVLTGIILAFLASVIFLNPSSVGNCRDPINFSYKFLLLHEHPVADN